MTITESQAKGEWTTNKKKSEGKPLLCLLRTTIFKFTTLLMCQSLPVLPNKFSPVSSQDRNT